MPGLDPGIHGLSCAVWGMAPRPRTRPGCEGDDSHGMPGVYQHCQEKHLHRYLAEFDFRYNARSVDDDARAVLAHKGAEGKRLTYRRTHSA